MIGGHEIQRGVLGASLYVYIDIQVVIVLIRLVDMRFSRVFPDPHCRYLRATGRSGFNQIRGHEIQQGYLELEVDLVLIRLVDMRFNKGI